MEFNEYKNESVKFVAPAENALKRLNEQDTNINILLNQIASAINNKLDPIKKKIFYPEKDYDTLEKTRYKDIDGYVIHGIVGIIGETGELASLLDEAIFNTRNKKENKSFVENLDIVNLTEELGDIMWFIALVCDKLELNMSDILNTNLSKLTERNKGKVFNSEATINRNTTKEREILEGRKNEK